MFEFTGLRILHQDMKNNGKTRAVFPFDFNKKSFSCIFMVDIFPFRLYLTTVGIKPMVFELEIDREYKTKSYIDCYRELVGYLEIKFDPNHKFIPDDFLSALNKKIPNRFSNEPTYTEVLVVGSKCRSVEDEKKIYFCGWKANPLGKKVTEMNLEKTRLAFGDQMANICKIKNISSRWTDIKNDEKLGLLSSI